MAINCWQFCTSNSYQLKKYNNNISLNFAMTHDCKHRLLQIIFCYAAAGFSWWGKCWVVTKVIFYFLPSHAAYFVKQVTISGLVSFYWRKILRPAFVTEKKFDDCRSSSISFHFQFRLSTCRWFFRKATKVNKKQFAYLAIRQLSLENWLWQFAPCFRPVACQYVFNWPWTRQVFKGPKQGLESLAACTFCS